MSATHSISLIIHEQRVDVYIYICVCVCAGMFLPPWHANMSANFVLLSLLLGCTVSVCHDPRVPSMSSALLLFALWWVVGADSRVVLPLAHQWGLVAIMTLLFHLFLSLPLGLTFQFTCVLGSGLMFGYSLYEIAHLYAHGHPLVSWMKFLEVSKDFHWYHHYKNSRTSFGFCSPFWDWVFQTMPQVRVCVCVCVCMYILLCAFFVCACLRVY